MKFKDKVLEMNPKMSETDYKRYIQENCPDQLLLKDRGVLCTMNMDCEDCWNREIPEMDLSCDEVNRMCKQRLISEQELVNNFLYEIKPQEVKAKIEAWNDLNEIKAGDVIVSAFDNETFGIVTKVLDETMHILWMDGSCGEHLKGCYKKDGQRDASEVFREIIRGA